ncbi:acyltransferase [Arthrobacter sp. PAMC25564]|uniref:acyltransferase family protein n=1 Tax=Arthrobacter sp. PAMC25564 TaxID=2565366 RepID=UPI0010A287E5|nr:acyltransferase [Arthrobacter sp. PAMC25564]QCB95547.1 acyltransferase [Arthrobacter sp. PAMC25564]
MRDTITVRPSWGRRLAGIEGLRGVAALSVVFYHLGLTASFQVQTGPLEIFFTLFNQGLTLFFVLSGFLLYRPFVAAIVQGAPLPSIRRYAYNRLLRIYPAYIVIFIITGLIVGSVYLIGSTHGLGPDNIGRLTDPLQIAANVLLVQMFVPQYVMSGLPVSWSLTAELTFYFVLPWVALLALRLVRKGSGKTSAMVCGPIAMVVAGLGITLWANDAASRMSPVESANFGFGQSGSAVLLRSFLAQADLFAYGMLAAVVVVMLHERGLERVQTWVKATLVIGAILMVLLGIEFARPILSSISGVAAALVLVAVVLPSSRRDDLNRAARVLEWFPFRFPGVISYGIYLWHLPIIFWLITHRQTFGQNTLSVPLNGLLVLAITLPLSTLTYYFVERPALKLKKSTGKAPQREPELERSAK